MKEREKKTNCNTYYYYFWTTTSKIASDPQAGDEFDGVDELNTGDELLQV